MQSPVVVDNFNSVYLLPKRTQSIVQYMHESMTIHSNCIRIHITYFFKICVVHVILLFKDVKALLLICSLAGWEMDRDPLYPFYRSYNLLPHVPDAYTDIYPGGRSDRHEQALVFSYRTREV